MTGSTPQLDYPTQYTAAPRPAPHRPGMRGNRRSSRRAWLFVVLAGVIGSALLAGVGRVPLVKPEGAGAFGEFFVAAGQPRLDREFIELTLAASATTLSYAVLGTALSLVIGFAGGVFTSLSWWSDATGATRRGRFAGWVIARITLVIPRGIHEVVWGLLLLVVFGIDPIVAVLAIGIPFGAVTAKVFSEILDEAGRGPYQALLASGASRPAAVMYGLVPPALPDLLSYAFYRFECAIRSAAILGLVGAGGLGFQLMLSFQSLQYREIWTLLYALIALSIAADYWSSAVRIRQTRGGTAPHRRDPVLVGSVGFGVVLIAVSAWWVGLDPAVLGSGRVWQLAGELAAEAWPPAPGSGGWPELAELSVLTLAMSILAIAVGFALGAVLAFPAARSRTPSRPAAFPVLARVGRGLVRGGAKLITVVLRAIPPPVWALLLLFVLYPGIFPGALALGVYTAGVLGRLMSEVVENVDDRPLRALRSHGAPRSLVLCYGVLPDAAPRFVAYGLYRWEVTIRETVVVGVVGAGGLGMALREQLSGFDYQAVAATLTALIVLTLVVDFTSAALRRAIR